jgi:glycerate dehydrogenase
MQIVILDAEIANPGDLSWEELEQMGRLIAWPNTRPNEVIQRVGKAEAVITNKVPITAEVIAACQNLQYIGLLSTGYNVVDIAAARAADIPVCNVPGYAAAGVAQSTFALLLEICNQVGRHSTEVRTGRWGQTRDWSFWSTNLVELAGKTMGIVGFGSIGRAVARIANATGMRVVAHSRTENEEGRVLAEYLPLEELLCQSDVVSLHCPLLPETEGVINAAAIAKMKDGAILLNTARGALLDEKAVAEALNSGKLYAAGLDVVTKEPITEENPLLGARNCFITPHIAWAAHETRQRLLGVVAANLRAFLAGSPTNVVNP